MCVCVCVCVMSVPLQSPHFVSFGFVLPFIVSSWMYRLSQITTEGGFSKPFRQMHKSYLWLLIGLCLLWSTAIHTEYSQNIAWINWIVNSSVQLWLENVCAILWPAAAPSAIADQGLLSTAQLQDSITWEAGRRASLHGERASSRLLGATLCRSTCGWAWRQPVPVWFCIFSPACLLMNGFSALLFIHYKLIKVLQHRLVQIMYLKQLHGFG